MNADALRLSLDERVIADWPKIEQAWRYRKAHYTLFGFDPQLLKKESSEREPPQSALPEKEKP